MKAKSLLAIVFILAGFSAQAQQATPTWAAVEAAVETDFKAGDLEKAKGDFTQGQPVSENDRIAKVVATDSFKWVYSYLQFSARFRNEVRAPKDTLDASGNICCWMNGLQSAYRRMPGKFYLPQGLADYVFETYKQDVAAERTMDASMQAQLDAEKASKVAADTQKLEKEEADRLMELKRQQNESDSEDAQVASKQAALKAECGDDYHHVRVGMTIDHASHCAARPFKLIGQLNRTDGVLVSTYRTCPSNCMVAYVIDGTISAWEKY